MEFLNLEVCDTSCINDALDRHTLVHSIYEEDEIQVPEEIGKILRGTFFSEELIRTLIHLYNFDYESLNSYDKSLLKGISFTDLYEIKSNKIVLTDKIVNERCIILSPTYTKFKSIYQPSETIEFKGTKKSNSFILDKFRKYYHPVINDLCDYIGRFEKYPQKTAECYYRFGYEQYIKTGDIGRLSEMPENYEPTTELYPKSIKEHKDLGLTLQDVSIAKNVYKLMYKHYLKKFTKSRDRRNNPFLLQTYRYGVVSICEKLLNKKMSFGTCKHNLITWFNMDISFNHFSYTKGDHLSEKILAIDSFIKFCKTELKYNSKYHRDFYKKLNTFKRQLEQDEPLTLELQTILGELIKTTKQTIITKFDCIKNPYWKNLGLWSARFYHRFDRLPLFCDIDKDLEVFDYDEHDKRKSFIIQYKEDIIKLKTLNKLLKDAV